jgi:hypothetical protein
MLIKVDRIAITFIQGHKINYRSIKFISDASRNLRHILNVLAIDAISFGSLYFVNDVMGQLRLKLGNLVTPTSETSDSLDSISEIVQLAGLRYMSDFNKDTSPNSGSEFVGFWLVLVINREHEDHPPLEDE